MKDLYQLQDDNIESFSQDWDDREQLQGMATQLDKLLNYINDFASKTEKGLDELNARMTEVENKIARLEQETK